MHRLLYLGVWIVLTVVGGTAAQEPPSRNGDTDRSQPGRRVTALLPGTPASSFATIQGNALDAPDRPLPNHEVRLRNARTGQIGDRQMTDEAGLFSYTNLDPGSYVVELMDDDLRVEATSALVTVDAGDVATTVVRRPQRKALAGLLRDSVGTASAVIAAAAGVGILAVDVTGEDISPR